MERVSVYIDGFNLYFGICDLHARYKRLDVHKISQAMLKDRQALIDVKYFTARISGDPTKESRQRRYLDAIDTTPAQVYYGHYLGKPVQCHRCHHTWIKNEEKMTDVNIATQLLLDAYHDRYDRAVIVGGDSDLIPPIQAVQSTFGKRVYIAFLPRRNSSTLRAQANGYFNVGKKLLGDNQFPNLVTSVSGFELTRPAPWN